MEFSLFRQREQAKFDDYDYATLDSSKFTSAYHSGFQKGKLFPGEQTPSRYLATLFSNLLVGDHFILQLNGLVRHLLESIRIDSKDRLAEWLLVCIPCDGVPKNETV